MGKPKGNFQLKTPKGTKDWHGKEVVLREEIFAAITRVFKRHGGVTIDTPVFELRDTLTGKYGEDSKLIYDLADQGGEICSLRYDLTVPFARFLAQHAEKNMKRYHIAKVYRRDQPAMTKGRMREFYQCDFDIAGEYDSMLPDAEILRVIKEVFEELPGSWKGKYTIKINHRKILDGIFQICGVLQDKIRTISSAVDKLDKSPWEEVRREMVEDKALDPAVADKIGEYVKYKGGKEIVEKLQAIPEVTENASAKQGLEEMALLCSYLEIYDVLPVLSIDMSLARGLDYYTGVIYEVVTEGSAPSAPKEEVGKSEKKQKKKSSDPDEDRSNDPTIGVGSVAAGGRYDELVGMFSGKPIPCVGISFGVDRIFSITNERLKADKDYDIRPTEIDVFIIALGMGKDFTGLLPERMKMAKQLWDAGIKAEFQWKTKPKYQKQFEKAEQGRVPWAILFGEDELKEGKVKIKDLSQGKEYEGKDKQGVLINLDDLVPELKERLEGRWKFQGENALPDRTAA